ncbi:MAG: hypothetical protein GWN00_29450 [Aliifodinibius sp.]|nr:hypothetical protein [Fodinibius sp.]NIV14907.1 hypothetical protein [Fodinibius sp.]NIY28766.1 hypothetical protein [Fodinibius sp.]
MDKRRVAIKLKSIEYLGGKCERCGFDGHPAALQFHHRDPSKKIFRISNAYKYNWETKIVLELEKCELVCANCHAVEHSKYYMED